jgi:fatty-acyl-CoA synthase
LSRYRAHDWVAHHARRRPDKPAIVDVELGSRLTYAELDRQIEACAAFLAREHGVVAGDRVAILCQNCPQVFVIEFACARLLAIFLPLNWRLAKAELEYLMGDAGPKVVFADERFIDMAHAVCSSSAVALAIELGAGTQFEAVLAQGGCLASRAEPDFDDVWMILYTSGTTGRPKGATLTHGQNYFQAVGLAAEYGITHASVGLTYTPTFHASGLFMFANTTLLQGGTTYLMRSFDAQRVLDLMCDPEIGLTHSLAIPTNLLMIRNLPSFETADLGGMVIPCGGAPVPTALIQTFAEHGAQIPQVWGMTELAGVSCSLPSERALENAGSCGPPLMNVDIAIIDQDGTIVTTPDTNGELVARGPMVTRGYWGLGEKNAQFYLAGGWFRTGDAGRMDAEGYVTIIGRWKDMYISGGENVYPAEVENVIYQMTEVDEVAVTGVPHELWGETGCACIVLKSGQVLTEDQVIEFCRIQLARYKVPKSVVFLLELPHSANGKVLKHLLRGQLGLDDAQQLRNAADAATNKLEKLS